MEKKWWAVVAVIVVVVVVVAVVGIWLLTAKPSTPAGNTVGLSVVNGVDVASNGYGQQAPSGSAYLRLTLEVMNNLSATLVVDNGSLVVAAFAVIYTGIVDPPGTSPIPAGETGVVHACFLAPIGTQIDRVRLSKGDAYADIPYDHLVSSPGPQTIGVSKTANANNWVLTIISVPSPHALTTTTFLMRWPANASVVTPPGQATLQTLKVASGGIQYLPVSGAAQTDLRINDVITISKAYTYTTGMTMWIADGTTNLWSSTL